jgi:hypothetical protein
LLYRANKRIQEQVTKLNRANCEIKDLQETIRALEQQLQHARTDLQRSKLDSHRFLQDD